mgnify:FL=1
MFYISETDNQLERLKNLGRLGAFVHIISSNDNYHPKLSKTTAVYLRPIDSKHGFIIPIDHEEGINVSKERVYDLLQEFSTLYTVDKKELLYHFNIQGAIDLSLLYSMTKFERLEYSKENSTINYFYHKNRDFIEVNKLIPISKLYESCEKLYDQVKGVVKYKIPTGFDFYNTTAINVFYLIEQTGLGVYYEAYNELFKPRNPSYNTIDNTVLTYYNLYNITSRPTNSFNSVNYAAIPHSENHRKAFKPQNDYFVELDFDGYHLRLLCDQIDYPLSEESAHKQLAKLYFEKEEITDEEYNKAKQINFQAIYGKIPEEHAFLEVFEKIDKFIKELWKEFEKKGEIKAPISEKPFTTQLKDMHPQKLMNYVMQSLETSRNILILKEVLRYLRDKKSKIVLYTYDAILFDFCKEDGKQTLEDIKDILEEGKKYPIKFKYSNNLVL